MKKIYSIFISLLIIIFCASLMLAQDNTGQQGQMFDNVYYPKDSSQQELSEVLIEDFENCDAWTSRMPPNQGFSRAKKVLGAPTNNKNGNYCLGVKEWGYKRGFCWTEITPPEPIMITNKIK